MIFAMTVIYSPWWLPPFFLSPYIVPVLFLGYALFRKRFSLQFLFCGMTFEAIALAVSRPAFLRGLLYGF